MNFGLRVAVTAALLLSGSAFADNAPPVVLADSPPAGSGLPGESFRNRVEFSIGFGGGPVSPDQYNGYVGAFNEQAGGAASGANVGSQIEVPILLTYYAPYYVMIRSGVELVSFSFPGEQIGNDQVKNYGGTAEIPIEIGGHYSFLSDRLILELAAGPAIAGFTSAGLSGSSGPTGEQLYASPTVGFDSELRAQYFLGPVFSLGLEIGYRILNCGTLHNSANTNVLVGGNTVNLDLSGFHADLQLGFDVL